MAKKNNSETTSEEKTQAKLDSILEVLQNIFILEAVKAHVPVEEVRTILHIDKKRIGVISKHIKAEKVLVKI